MRIRYEYSAKKSQKSRKTATTNKHRVPIPKMVEDIIRTSDIVLEVLDIRFIEKTRNKKIEKSILGQDKKIIFVLNKSDLVDLNELKRNFDFEELRPYVFFSCKNRKGSRDLRDRIKIEVKKLKMKGRRARIGVVGYPNTGKSSLINILSGKKGVGTSAEAGFTKATHKIRLNKDILILDTPGVIPDEEANERKTGDLKKHVEIGIKRYDRIKEPEFIVDDFIKNNPGVLEKYYGIDSKGDTEILLEELGRKMNFLKKGGVVDSERTARWIIKDIQEGKIK